MGKTTFGAIGVGGRLTHVIQNLLKAHGDAVELRALSDEAPAALAKASETFGKDLPTYDDYHDLIARDDLDWVLIGSKNYLHRDHCVAAFAAGKHVFCEKPMATSIQQCEEIRDAHRAAGTLFATGFVLRHAPLYCQLNQLLQEGYVGRIISMEANELLSPDHGGYIMRNWRRHRDQNGPHLLEKCSHDIDLINWMIGSLPSRAASFGGLDIFVPENKPVADKLAQPDDEPPLYRSWPSWEDIDPFTSDKDVEDNQVVILEYRNKVRVTFHTNCCSAFPQRRMQICGLEGSLEADLVSGDITGQRIGRGTEKESFPVAEKGGHGGGDQIIADDLAECMLTGKRPKASGEEGFISAITCLAIDESMRTGQVVDLEPTWSRFEL